ncbi:hypothetical protein QYE76_042529 [Lolium multiflorum]|uniref:DUF4216 domain-containing protein n=1 Tax=Lolium multiflorum TaxID=4521 RepID=A0AAD8TFS4_LOLMU|nr:hypothetical protein QYE76_042529 [Lolium multiflorum]
MLIFRFHGCAAVVDGNDVDLRYNEQRVLVARFNAATVHLERRVGMVMGVNLPDLPGTRRRHGGEGEGEGDQEEARDEPADDLGRTIADARSRCETEKERENLDRISVYMLAKTPSSTITTFQGYEINGNTFYTIAQDKKSTNQNSGVRFDAATENGQKVTYYGYIEEIWELDYGPSFKVPLFRCKWFKLTGGGVKVDQQYGMTMVDFNNLGYLDEPFVLAKDVAQVFYVKDMSSKPRKRKDKKTIGTSCDDPKRHIVLSGKRNIVGVEDKTDMSEDYNMFGEIPPFKVNTDPSIKLNDEDAPWIRPNRKQAGTQGKK